jgi:hypothetical protein
MEEEMDAPPAATNMSVFVEVDAPQQSSWLKAEAPLNM